MKFRFHVSRLANLFFFVSNLSEWSPYCRKEYNHEWLKQKHLQQSEREALKHVRNILWKHKTLGRYFFRTEQEAWRNIAKKLSKREYEALCASFAVFLPRFSALWKEEKSNLQNIAAAFSRGTSSPVNKTLIELSTLYAPHRKPRSITTIFLLTSPITKRLVSGGGKITSKILALECSKTTAKNNIHDLFVRVLLHELVHTMFEDRIKNIIRTCLQSKGFSSIKRELARSAVYRETLSFAGPIKEMVAISLLPEGYLAERYFNANVSKSLLQRNSVRECRLKHTYYDLMLFATWELLPIAREYSTQKKPIDARYLREVIMVWRQFNRTNLSRWDLEKRTRSVS